MVGLHIPHYIPFIIDTFEEALPFILDILSQIEFQMD